MDFEDLNSKSYQYEILLNIQLTWNACWISFAKSQCVYLVCKARLSELSYANVFGNIFEITLVVPKW